MLPELSLTKSALNIISSFPQYSIKNAVCNIPRFLVINICIYMHQALNNRNPHSLIGLDKYIDLFQLNGECIIKRTE